MQAGLMTVSLKWSDSVPTELCWSEHSHGFLGIFGEENGSCLSINLVCLRHNIISGWDEDALRTRLQFGILLPSTQT